MNKINNLMKASYIGAYVVAGLTFLASFLMNSPFMLIDVVVIGLCGAFIMRKQSRAAAVVLFLFYLIGIIQKVMLGTNIGLSPLFLVLFACGVYATFAYHKYDEPNNGNLID